MYSLQCLVWHLLWLCASLQHAWSLPISHTGKQVVLNTGRQSVLGNVWGAAESVFDGHGAQSISEALKKGKVIPEVLPAFVPKVDLKLHYLAEKTDTILRNIRLRSRIPVDLGNTIPLLATTERPSGYLTPLAREALTSVPAPTCLGGKPLTLVLVDADATSKTGSAKGQMWHWVVTGLKLRAQPASKHINNQSPMGCMLDFSLAKDPLWGLSRDGHSKDLVEYMLPAPHSSTGKRRYTFVLLEEKEGRPDQPLRKPTFQPHAGYKHNDPKFADWAKDNGLVPIGANFFYA